MKKLYTTLTCLLLLGTTITKAQDTLLYEGFQFVMTSYLSHVTTSPPANTQDTMWYDYDKDLLTANTATRSDDWWQVLPFADADLYTPAGDTNVVMSSNSWFSSPGVADNWLITRNVQLGVHDTLFWKSAPFQTPRYLDGYEVLISITTNEEFAFVANGGATLFTAAEMSGLSTTNDSVFSSYQFSPSGAFVHGLDGMYTEYANDSMRLRGQLRPFSVPLDAYANKNVFIAFHHNSNDDNLISIDDVMIRGTLNPNASVAENITSELNMALYPNPASENTQLNFTLKTETAVTILVLDVTGKLVYSENKGKMLNGRHFATINTSILNKGFYTVTLQTKDGSGMSKLIVK